MRRAPARGSDNSEIPRTWLLLLLEDHSAAPAHDNSRKSPRFEGQNERVPATNGRPFVSHGHERLAEVRREFFDGYACWIVALYRSRREAASGLALTHVSLREVRIARRASPRCASDPVRRRASRPARSSSRLLVADSSVTPTGW